MNGDRRLGQGLPTLKSCKTHIAAPKLHMNFTWLHCLCSGHHLAYIFRTSMERWQAVLYMNRSHKDYQTFNFMILMTIQRSPKGQTSSKPIENKSRWWHQATAASLFFSALKTWRRRLTPSRLVKTQDLMGGDGQKKIGSENLIPCHKQRCGKTTIL